MNNTELKPYDKVLVRDLNDEEWKIDFFSRNRDLDDYPYVCISNVWKQCIPYEGNESLLGTINTPKPKYEFKKGDIVLVWNSKDDTIKKIRVLCYFDIDIKKFVVYEDQFKNVEDFIDNAVSSWDNCIPFKPENL